jgi:hypothetical protein
MRNLPLCTREPRGPIGTATRKSVRVFLRRFTCQTCEVSVPMQTSIPCANMYCVVSCRTSGWFIIAVVRGKYKQPGTLIHGMTRCMIIMGSAIDPLSHSPVNRKAVTNVSSYFFWCYKLLCRSLKHTRYSDPFFRRTLRASRSLRQPHSLRH